MSMKVYGIEQYNNYYDDRKQPEQPRESEFAIPTPN